jgi:hypothetical protein
MTSQTTLSAALFRVVGYILSLIIAPVNSISMVWGGLFQIPEEML